MKKDVYDGWKWHEDDQQEIDKGRKLYAELIERGWLNADIEGICEVARTLASKENASYRRNECSPPAGRAGKSDECSNPHLKSAVGSVFL